MSARSRGARATAIGVFVLGVLRYAPVIDEPWSNSFGDMNSCEYTTRFVRTFERVGFAGTGGVPHFWALPVEGTPAWGPYRHHPPLHSWMIWGVVRLLGFNEPACRLAPVLLCALAFALAAGLVAARHGPLVGGATGVLGLSIPLGFQYGSMVNPESAVLGLSMLTAALHFRLRAAAPWKYSIACVAQLAAFQMDWAGAFVGVALCVHEIMTPREQRRLVRTFTAFLVTGVASALLTIRLLAGKWSFARSAGFVRDLAFNETAEPLDWHRWLVNQGTFWTELMGRPLTVAAAACLPVLLIAAFRRDGALERLTCALAVPGLLNVFGFTKHSIDHEFWWFYVLPYVTMAPAVALRRLGVPHRVVAVILVALAAHAAWLTIARHRALRTDEFLRQAETVNGVVGPDDYLVTPVSMGRAGFYIDAWLFDGVDGMRTLEQVRAARAFVDAGLVAANRVVFVVPPHYPPFGRDDVRGLGRIEDLEGGGFRLVVEP